jgi:hypothetical protein
MGAKDAPPLGELSAKLTEGDFDSSTLEAVLLRLAAVAMIHLPQEGSICS